MADETKTVIIDIEVETKDFAQEIGKVNEKIRDNREEIKELSKDYDLNIKEIAELELANKDLSKSKQDLTKQSKLESNSLNALRAELAKQVKERNTLNTSSKEGAARFLQLQKSIKGLNDEISGFEQAGGDFRRNVGNYPQLLKEAAGQTKIFGISLNQGAEAFSNIASAAGGSTKSVGLASKAMRVFKIALASTGIGALVVALGSMVTYLQRTQEGQEKLNKVLAQAGAVVDVILDRIAMLGKAISLVFEGEFTKAAETAKAAFQGVAAEIEEEIELAGKLSDGLADIEKREAAVVVKNAERLRDIKELNKIAEDTSRSAEERLAAAGKAIELEQLRVDSLLAIQRDKTALLALEYDRTESTTADLLELNQERARVFELETASLEAQTTLQNKYNILLEQTRKAQTDINAAEQASIPELEGITAKKIAIGEEFNIAKVKTSKAAAEQETVNAEAAATAITGITGTLIKNEKANALTQILTSSAVAIAGAVKAAQVLPFPANIAAVISGIASVSAGIGQAKAQLSQAGGPSSGGSGGGSVASLPTLAAGVTDLRAGNPLVSQFSQPALDQSAQASATARAIQGLPSPTVSVVDINIAQSSRTVKLAESTLG